MKKLVLYIIVFYFTAAHSQNVNVPTGYWGYLFLDRLEAKNIFQFPNYHVRPLPREAFAKIILEADRRMAQSPGLLTGVERQQLNQLRVDFIDEIHSIDHLAGALNERERHLAEWAEESSFLYLDLYGQQNINIDLKNPVEKSRPISITKAGFIIRGGLGGQVSFNLDYYNSATKGTGLTREKDLNFNPSKGLPINITGTNVYQDNALAYFCLQRKWLRLEIGKDELSWGPGYSGQLSLSANTPPAEMFRVNADFNRFNFTLVHSFLRSGLGTKYLSGHRLDYQVGKFFQLGFSETAIYGQRDIQPFYLLPVLPFLTANPFRKKNDNVSASIDVSTFIIPSTKIYCEFFLYDAISSHRYAIDKWALLTGCLWSEPFHCANTFIRMEYAGIQPQVYANKDSNAIYTHYNNSIGHWLGPNSEMLFLQGSWQINKDIQFKIAFEHIRKGEGSLDTRGENDQSFMKGRSERQNNLILESSAQIYHDVFFSFTYKHSNKTDASLRYLPRVPNHAFMLQLYLNY